MVLTSPHPLWPSPTTRASATPRCSAEAVAAGARDAGAHVTVIAVDRMADEDWDVLDAADAIVFGSATYMGNVSAGFQAFAEQTGRRCLNGTLARQGGRGVHQLRRQEPATS